MNTYDTVPVSELSEEDIKTASKAHVLAIASPSAITAWMSLVGDKHDIDLAVACIGLPPLQG